MQKRCVICNCNLIEDYGKIRGTMLKVTDEKKKNQFIYVCSECQKKEGWIEKAKIKSA